MASDKVTLSELLSRLKGVKETVKPSGERYYMALCPAHDDHDPSLSIREGEDGRILVHCFAGCPFENICLALGISPKALGPFEPHKVNSQNTRPKGDRSYESLEEALGALGKEIGEPTAVWDYHDAQGRLVGKAVRFDPPGGKTFRPLSLGDDCRWRMKAMPTPRPLYRLPELLQCPPDEPVLVCEGEKAADVARKLGFVATTAPGGANAAQHTNWGPLAGRKVVIVPDNDGPGRKYADEVGSRLCALKPLAKVYRLDLSKYAPRLPEGGDLADIYYDPEWCGLDLGGSAGPEELANWLRRTIDTLQPWQPPAACSGACEPPAPVEDLPYRPFPVEALPEPARSFVFEGARAFGCDPSFLALPLLVALGAAIGLTRKLRLKSSWTTWPMVWGVIVGESGTGKTPALKLVQKLFAGLEEQAEKRYEQEYQKYEAEKERCDKARVHWRRDKRSNAEPPPEPKPPVRERFLVSDITVEALASLLKENPRGLLLFRDELAGWIEGFDRYAPKWRGGDSAHWLSMHDAGRLTVDRKTGEPRTVSIPRAGVWVVGGIQPGILRRVLRREHWESGLAARLLLTYPPRRPRRWTDADTRQESFEAMERVVRRLYGLSADKWANGQLQAELVQLGEEARAVFVSFFNRHNEEAAKLSDNLATAWSKLEHYAPRLALIIHYVRWAAGEIGDETTLDRRSMEAGITLVEWFKHETKRVYAMLHESAAEAGQRRLLEWIARQGGRVTAREAAKGCRWLRDNRAAEAALGALVQQGLGQWEDKPPSGQGGRPTREFVLNRRPPAPEPEAPAEPAVGETPSERGVLSAKPPKSLEKFEVSPTNGFADTCPTQLATPQPEARAPLADRAPPLSPAEPSGPGQQPGPPAPAQWPAVPTKPPGGNPWANNEEVSQWTL